MSTDPAGLLFARVPNLDSDLASYLKSYLDDEASCQTLAIDGDSELLSLLEPALEENGVEGQEMEHLLDSIKDLMLQSIGGKTEAGHGNKARALDKVINLNFNAGNTLMPGSVDISSTSKGRNTQGMCILSYTGRADWSSAYKRGLRASLPNSGPRQAGESRSQAVRDFRIVELVFSVYGAEALTLDCLCTAKLRQTNELRRPA